MGFKVNNLAGSLSKSGVAQASHFEVYIFGSKAGGGRDLALRADSVNIPGRTIATTEHRFINYGPLSKVPYSQVYGDLNVSFIMSEDMREKSFFEEWQNEMVNTGAFESERTGSWGSTNAAFNTHYYDNYAGTVEVRQYGANGELRTIHKILDAYPVLIGEVGMDWSSGELLKLQVTFAFRNYKFVTRDGRDQASLGAGFSFNLTKGGKLQAGLRVPGLGNIGLKKPPLGVIAAASPQLINNGIKSLGNVINSGRNAIFR